MASTRDNKRLPRTDPERQGIASAAILAFIEAAEKKIDHLHSFMLLRHGSVVAEGWWSPYAPDIPHLLFSLSKSFTSSAVGLVVEAGLLSEDDKVLSFFPDEAPDQVSDNLAAMRVRHLLSMSTGHGEDSTGHLRDSADSNWVRAFLARPVEHEPGTHFLYDSGATYMLSAIVQKLTGQTLLEYLLPRLFEPLGVFDPTWASCPRGINTGGWGLSITTEDIACFGQMYLQNGLWNGRRILPAQWVATATAFHSDNSGNTLNENPDWQQGYGYQFWRCQHNAYRGDGAFGQFCVVMPDQDAVFVATAGVEDMQSVLDLVWKYLLPAMGPRPLPDAGVDAVRLSERSGVLALVPAAGAASTPIGSRIAGQQYRFADNEQGIEALVIEPDHDECTFVLRTTTGDHRIRCGYRTWTAGEVSIGLDALHAASTSKVAASYAWTADNTLTVKMCFYESPYCPVITCRFVDNEVRFNMRLNVSFGEKCLPELVGMLA